MCVGASVTATSIISILHIWDMTFDIANIFVENEMVFNETIKRYSNSLSRVNSKIH